MSDNENPPCACRATPSRRRFLQFAGGAASVLLPRRVFAGPFASGAQPGEGLDALHPVPRDKKLSPEWVASLFARGTPSQWKEWSALKYIGMPVSGIGSGTVYLGGDGRLWGWDVFNAVHEGCVPNPPQPERKYRERDGANYSHPPEMTSPWNLQQGLALHVDGRVIPLDHTGFPDITFTGQYPVGTVEYRDPASSLSATLEAYSPFIPLEYDDSSLPVAVLEVTLHNRGDRPLAVTLEAFLENAGLKLRKEEEREGLFRQAARLPLEGGVLLQGTITGGESGDRPDILLADFEAGTWEKTGWVAEGDAFKGGPFPRAKAEPYHAITGHEGAHYAHSHNSRAVSGVTEADALTGTLTSPVFRAERRHLAFLLCGGSHAGQTCLELLADGAVVASVAADNSSSFRERRLDLTPWKDRELRLRLADRATGGWGNIGLDRVVLTDRAASMADAFDLGSVALALLGDGGEAQAVRGRASEQETRPARETQVFAARRSLTVPAGGRAAATVLIAWHFPKVDPRMNRTSDPTRWYAGKFADAAAVVRYAARELPRLSARTKLFRDTWYGAGEGAQRGTLPLWLLERSLWTVTALTTNGSYRLTQNRFWGWEGTGCCPGTCTHVWHYGQSAGRLFPALEISLRENTDFSAEAFTPEGSVRFRGAYSGADHPCIDGQVGILLRCYREHLGDPTGEFLKRNWPAIRKAAEFLVRSEAQGKPDGNNGVFTQRFENTLDAKWGGEVPWLVGLYLAGLVAAAAMADLQGEAETARRWRAIVARGRQAYNQYFDPGEGYFKSRYEEKDLPPVHIGPGCHIDQCLADFWLAQVGLPALGERELLRHAMNSLYDFNFMPDMGAYRAFCARQKTNPGRWYALEGEAGLIMATWPHGGMPEERRRHWSFMYFQECMTGFEHAAAALMVSLAEGEGDPLLQKGLAVCRAIHDRYDAARRNPFNEVECSDHYARAMSSYGVFIAATGFQCDAARGRVRFDPKIRPRDAALPFIGMGAWGRYAQTRSAGRFAASIEVRHGAMKLSAVEVRDEAGAGRSFAVTAGARTLSATSAPAEGGLVRITLSEPVVLRAGDRLDLAAG